MAVFGAMISYLLQGSPSCGCAGNSAISIGPAGARSALLGASLTVIIAVVTIYFQLTDPVYQKGVIGVAIWYALTILYFAVYGRKTLVFSPEEEFAVKHREGSVKV